MAKYKFRKMYFICQDKKVIDPNIEFTNAYQHREYADNVCSDANKRKTHFLWEDKTKPIPVRSVEGFYLVPEKLYDEILRKHVEGDD